MKKYITLIIIPILLFIFCVPVFADSVYGSLTDSSSQTSILVGAMLNDPDFDLFGDFIVARSGDQEYKIYFNINGNTCKYYRYYNTGTTYNSHYTLVSGTMNNFTLSNSENYTLVGNNPGNISSSVYRTYLYQTILKYCIPFILILLAFYVFRIHKRSGGVSL